MKIKQSVAIFVIPTLILFIIVINVVFGVFFHNHVLEHEKLQIHYAAANISSYVSERSDKYIGSVSDWGHWDDTYEYVLGNNPVYIASNMTESTYDYLDLSIVILTDRNERILYSQYYDPAEASFVDFPTELFGDIDRAITFSRNAEDTSGILRLGTQLYFIATSDITDSLSEMEAVGTLIFGRQIDARMIADIENISDCSIDAINVLPDVGLFEQSSESAIITQEYIKDPADLIRMELAIPNASDLASSVVVSMTMPRTFYTAGMREVVDFSVFNTLGSIVVSLVLFMLLGRHVTKPLNSLMNDVRSIEVTDFKSIRIPDSGINEFSYLRKSINSLLRRIETSQKEMVETKEKLQATLVSVGDGVITVGIDGNIQFLNPVAQKLTGWTSEEATGMPLETVFNIINEYTREPIESPVTEVYKTGEIVELANHTLLITKEGAEVPVEDTAAPIRNTAGDVIGCVLVFRDFSERKEKQRYIEYLSYHDHLTGLFNRRYFEDELKRIDIENNLPLSFVYADVNGLKMINDAYGHDRGDELIRSVAEALTVECRPGDVITRVGGDEFVVIMPQTTTEAAEALLKRIDSRLEEIHILDVPVSISYGWDTKVDTDQSAREILRRAESSMYQKKEINSDGLRDEILRSVISALRAQETESEKVHE